MSRVLISMPEKFLNEIDNVADNENRTRSELIREALRTYINRNKIRNNVHNPAIKVKNTLCVIPATIYPAKQLIATTIA